MTDLPATRPRPSTLTTREYNLANRNLTPARIEMLRWLADHPRASINEWADEHNCTRGAGHYHLIALRNIGLIEYESDKVRTYRLTPAGWSALGREPRCAACGQPLPSPSTPGEKP